MREQDLRYLVVEINQVVKKILHVYANQYPNYREAAQAAEINKDTFASYMKGGGNVAGYVFQRILQLMAQNEKSFRFQETAEGWIVGDQEVELSKKNGQQIDHVMYTINEPVLHVIKEYCAAFPNRAKAARRIEINPRTMKAYLKGDVRSFPRAAFWEALNYLDKNGTSSRKILEQFGAQNWPELLEVRQRSKTLNITEEEIFEEIRALFHKGTLRNGDVSQSLLNAADRIHGAFGRSVQGFIKFYSQESAEFIATKCDKKNASKAWDRIVEWEKFLALYSKKAVSIVRALPSEKKFDWQADVAAYEMRKDAHKLQVLQALGVDPFSGRPNRRQLDVHLYLRDAREYDFHENFVVGERVYHHTFGFGEVKRVDAGKQMLVQFEGDADDMILVINSGVARPEFGRMEDRK